MIAAAWAWALGGVVALLVLGTLAMLALGVLSLPGELGRRLRQTAAGGRTERGRPLPDEVPDATAAETAEQVETPPER